MQARSLATPVKPLMSRSKGSLTIATTLALAFALSVAPSPGWLLPLQPEWTLLVLIYWSMAAPQITGVGVAWVCGLFADVLHGSLLGQHALAYALVAWVTILVYQRIRLFPLLQQAGVVFLLMVAHQSVLYLAMGFQDIQPSPLLHWLPALSSAVLWPWLFTLLRHIRRRAGI